MRARAPSRVGLVRHPNGTGLQPLRGRFGLKVHHARAEVEFDIECRMGPGAGFKHRRQVEGGEIRRAAQTQDTAHLLRGLTNFLMGDAGCLHQMGGARVVGRAGFGEVDPPRGAGVYQAFAKGSLR